MRPDSDLMTAEFASDCCTMALVVEGLDGSLKDGFPCTWFHSTHDSIKSIEQVHCHPYQPLTPIAFIFTQNDYITDPQGFWSADCATIVAYSQVQCFHGPWRQFMDKPYDPGADSKGL